LDVETLNAILFNHKARKDLRKVRKGFRQSFADFAFFIKTSITKKLCVLCGKKSVVLDVETLNAILFNRKKRKGLRKVRKGFRQSFADFAFL
jgi:mRNA-degrading endonuclease RelE of RelBE toxin-antitoxin system